MRFDTRPKINRRSFIRTTGLASLLTLSRELQAFSASATDPARLRLMEFDVSYTTHVMKLPKEAKDVNIWIPVPPSDAAQEITKFSIGSPIPYEMKHGQRFGTKMVHAKTGRLDEPFAVEVRYHVKRERAGIQEATLTEEERREYLKLTKKVRMTPDVEAFGRQAIGGATDPYEIGQRVFEAIRETLYYDKTIPGCGTGDTQWIMTYRKGKCDDYHALMMAVLIANGVPVRWEQGFPLPFPEGGNVSTGALEGDCTGSHCWLSFYAPSHGWVPVDVSEADKGLPNSEFFFGHLPPNRFQVSVGRSVTLAPPQGGDPLSTFAFAYAEADGIPLIYLANYENEIRYEVTRVEMDGP